MTLLCCTEAVPHQLSIDIRSLVGYQHTKSGCEANLVLCQWRLPIYLMTTKASHSGLDLSRSPHTVIERDNNIQKFICKQVKEQEETFLQYRCTSIGGTFPLKISCFTAYDAGLIPMQSSWCC